MSLLQKITSIFSTPQKNPYETKLIELLDCEKDPIILCTQDGKIVYFNSSSKEFFSNIEESLSIFTILRGPIIKEIFEELAETDKKRIETEMTIRIPKEHNIKIGISHNENFYLIHLQDITEQKMALKMHGDFVANVSHELRTPLASIVGFIETLQGPAKGDAGATEQFLGIMEAQAKRMNHLINGLLSLSRIELDQHILPTDNCNLTKILEDVCNALTPIAKNKNIEIIKDFTEETRKMIGETQQIFQVFQNIIENAIKYSNNDTKITIGCEDSDDKYIVSVEDQGYGIAPEHLPRLSERFYRVDEARHRSQGGAGLGLSIVSKIIDRHKGQMKVTSEVGKGSRFEISFPILKQEKL